MRSRSLFLPLLLIILGSLWFLKSTDLLPDTAAIVSIGLAVLGFMVMVMDGLNKQSIVSGPLLMYVGAAIYLYHEYIFGMSHIFSVGMVWLGFLLLLSRSSLVPDKYARHIPPPKD